MLKNRIVVLFLAMCLILGTVPFALGATAKTANSTNTVYISALYVGAPGEKPYQEYVKITNKGTTSVNIKSWKIKDLDVSSSNSMGFQSQEKYNSCSISSYHILE